ncbi:MAG: hypothetical protein L0Z55_11475 [Planctomycetes bacterium]|nr:hypothetical protein [Planctomycetota bacterium]
MSPSNVVAVSEIIGRFPASFVLIDRCKFTDRFELTHGRVVLTSNTQEPVYEALRECPNSMVIYTGPGAEEADGAFIDRGATWGSLAAAH